jgi:hypothetical protein
VSQDQNYSAAIDSFRDALRKGKLQQRIHDEWVDVNSESVTIDYVVRAHHWRIIPNNLNVDQCLPDKTL